MRSSGQFPTETSDCILGEGQTCKFFQTRKTNDKGVFIAAPVGLQKLVDIVKEICVELGLEPMFATDKMEYNRFAFCHNICRPMLEASFVVIIGDWEGNTGNANVAFEYGIATALGCEIIPIRVEGEKGGPFDIVALHAIILRDDWNKIQKLTATRNKIKGPLNKARERVALRELTEELPKGLKKSVIELIHVFKWSDNFDEMRTTMSMLRRIWQTDNRTLRDPDFVEWALSVLKYYGKAKGIKVLHHNLEPLFFEMLEAIVAHSFYKAGGLVAEDKEFAASLGRIATSNVSPIYARKSAIRMLASMANYLDRPKLLAPLFRVVTNTKLNKDEYSQLGLESELKNYLVNATGRGGSLTYLLKSIGNAKQMHDQEVMRRVKLVEDALQRP